MFYALPDDTYLFFVHLIDNAIYVGQNILVISL